ncbi:Ig-like domain-containing protein [Ferruginibacter paludis]|uniref:NHL domain-containing protein n=1 Tax=Ferruginibacter paludis TaxID=1310417 RepID=UPI0025B365C5|nr:Ig-like domain-containing protein [Ferruginibacter paludis]MDN3655359.1 Ig-like domain-containing protein [Ferruginibacter paludis]
MNIKYNFVFILIFLFHSAIAQTITTYAGRGTAGNTGDGGLATLAQFSNPFGVAFGSDNNLYLVDNSNHRIRKVDAATHIITTVVGLGSNGGNCPLNQAGLLNPRGIAFDKQGNMYISDASTCIRKVDIATQTITTIAGVRGITNIYGNVLGDNGPAINAYFDGAADIALDVAGNIFVADMGNNRIRKIDISTGVISTFAGGGYNAGEGYPATETALGQPLGIAFDSKGNLYIADQGHHVIRKVDAATNITSIVARKLFSWGYAGDGGLAVNALINTPTAVTLDKDDNVYLTDCLNNRVRKVDKQNGIISTVAGTGIAGYAGDCGPAKDALLNWPWSVVLDKSQQIYFTELNNNIVRKISSIQSDLIKGSETICLHDSIVLLAAIPGGVWTSDNDAVAQIDSNGLVKGLTAGTAIIHYTIQLSGCEFITSNRTVSVKAVSENAVNSSSKNLCTGTKLTLSQLVSGGFWYSNNNKVATIDSAGHLQCFSTGTAELKYQLNETCTITDKVSVKIFKPQTIFLGNDTTFVIINPWR